MLAVQDKIFNSLCAEGNFQVNIVEYGEQTFIIGKEFQWQEVITI